jgi:hypothetical protein
MRTETAIKIKLYNKLSIVVFSAFGSTFLGAVLYSMNLISLEKKSKIIGPILLAMFFNVFIISWLRKLGFTEKYTFFPVNILGGVILAFVFWNKQIEPEIKYISKPIWAPLIIIILLYGFFIGMNLIK